MRIAPPPLRRSSLNKSTSAATPALPEATSTTPEATPATRHNSTRKHTSHKLHNIHPENETASTSAAVAAMPEGYQIQDSALSLRETIPASSGGDINTAAKLYDASNPGKTSKLTTTHAHDAAVAAAAAAGHAQSQSPSKSHAPLKRGATEVSTVASVAPLTAEVAVVEPQAYKQGGLMGMGMGPPSGPSGWSDMLPAEDESFLQGAPTEQSQPQSHFESVAVNEYKATDEMPTTIDSLAPPQQSSMVPMAEQRELSHSVTDERTAPETMEDCSSAIATSEALGAPAMKRHNHSSSAAVPEPAATRPRSPGSGALHAAVSSSSHIIPEDVRAIKPERRQHETIGGSDLASFPVTTSPGVHSPASASSPTVRGVDVPSLSAGTKPPSGPPSRRSGSSPASSGLASAADPVVRNYMHAMSNPISKEPSPKARGRHSFNPSLSAAPPTNPAEKYACNRASLSLSPRASIGDSVSPVHPSSERMHNKKQGWRRHTATGARSSVNSRVSCQLRNLLQRHITAFFVMLRQVFERRASATFVSDGRHACRWHIVSRGIDRQGGGGTASHIATGQRRHTWGA